MEQVTLSNLIPLIPLGSFLLLLLLQTLFPKRDLALSGLSRALHNLLLFFLNTIMLRLLVPLTLLMAAAWATKVQYGLFNLVQLPDVIVALLCVVALDFAIYWQHVATHKFAFLWRLHKVHHADLDFDVTTAIRFHPIELLLSLLYKSAIVVLLGAPAVAVIVFELLLFVGPAFNHSNFAIPPHIDSLLRRVVVTPDVHRVHHSTLVSEQNTNYGFFLIWWDKMFGSYTVQPAQGHYEMEIGLAEADEACETVDRMLLAPFR